MLCMVSHPDFGSGELYKETPCTESAGFSNPLHKAFPDFMYYEIYFIISFNISFFLFLSLYYIFFDCAGQLLYNHYTICKNTLLPCSTKSGICILRPFPACVSA